jgi:uncharacterized protein (DUF2147 family)
MKLLSVLTSLLVASITSAFTGSHHHDSNTAITTTTTTTALSAHSTTSRASFLSSSFAAAVGICTAATATTGMPAWASDADSALKGTKKDPAYEACLSKCMYECTKPKGAEQKSRAECLPECKVQCATTKEQLLKGTPIKK